MIQMADLHIGSADETVPEEKDFFSKSAELIEEKVPHGETLLLCLCGDIIDSKNLSKNEDELIEQRYNKAVELIEGFKTSLEDHYKIIIKCCPGNHDTTHMKFLKENFIDNVDGSNSLSQKKLEFCYTVSVDRLDTKIIFVNSCADNQFKEGRIDYRKLEQELRKYKDCKKVLVLHHTIMSMFDGDSSSIRNAAQLINLVDKYHVIGILHGHIHGRQILTLGENQCKLIGTGALFSRNNPNVNSQFNIIELKNSRFLKILNCRYRADGGSTPWDIEELNHEKDQNIFVGNKFSTLYKQVIDALDLSTPIYNMRMEVVSSYETYENDVEKFFKKDILKIGDREWSYGKLATEWQAAELPDDLYFNHGSYFKVGGKIGIDYVAEALKQKPTSNRIVLPTYNMEKVNQSLDDKDYLPSLVSIQFGKNGETLLVHMHLRALEATRFLKINICEIEYLLSELKKKAVEFQNVNIIISAFRVQKKEKFNCFLKAEIDALKFAKLSLLVYSQKFEELVRLFKEKKDAKETITKVDGIQKVYEAMQAFNEMASEDGKPIVYNHEILSTLKNVLDMYELLDRIHKQSSVQSIKEHECEKQIDELLENVITNLEMLKEASVS